MAMPTDNQMLKDVGHFISTRTPLRRSDKLVVGLSGGADSVALLHILISLNFDVVALHCNFHLRGDESNRDQQHAAAIAEKMGIELIVKHFDVEAHRKACGGSVEMACRELRYEWFEQQRTLLGAAAIAVAHHRDDNIETMMLNMLRGTSISGMCGMEPFDTRTSVVRPLLDKSRAEIEKYLADNGIEFVTDSSNLSNDFRRNKLRNTVIPALIAEFPDAALRINDTMTHLRENRDFYRYATSSAIAPYIHDDCIDILSLSSHPHASLLLFEHLRDTGVTRTQCDNIIASASASGLQFFTPKGRYLLDRGMLRLSTENPLPQIDILEAPIDALDPKLAPDCAFFSAELMSHINEIEVRTWCEGDRLKPWGMNGSKLVSDLFSDAKIAIDSKDNYPIVALHGEILWVAGLRASRLYPIPADATTLTIMRLVR